MNSNDYFDDVPHFDDLVDTDMQDVDANQDTYMDNTYTDEYLSTHHPEVYDSIQPPQDGPLESLGTWDWTDPTMPIPAQPRILPSQPPTAQPNMDIDMDATAPLPSSPRPRPVARPDPHYGHAFLPARTAQEEIAELRLPRPAISLPTSTPISFPTSTPARAPSPLQDDQMSSISSRSASLEAPSPSGSEESSETSEEDSAESEEEYDADHDAINSESTDEEVDDSSDEDYVER